MANSIKRYGAKYMRNLVGLAFFIFLLSSNPNRAYALRAAGRTWMEIAHKSQIVGIIRVEHIVPGEGARPPLLQVRLIRLFKGEYSSKNVHSNTLLLDLRSATFLGIQRRFDGKNKGMSNLYQPGQIFLAYMTPAKLETFDSERVMKLSSWEFEALHPINQNILGAEDNHESGSLLLTTYNLFNALDRFCEIDALDGDERKLALRLLEKQLKRYPNHDLDEAFNWLSMPPKTPPVGVSQSKNPK